MSPQPPFFCPGECPGLHLFPVDKTGGPGVSASGTRSPVNPMPFYTVLPFLYMLYIRGDGKAISPALKKTRDMQKVMIP